MYILLLDAPAIDNGHIVLGCAHASLSGYLTFLNYKINSYNIFGRLVLFCKLIRIAIFLFFRKEVDIFLGTETEEWAKESFRKVICLVSKKEFEQAKAYGENMKDYRVMVEMGLGGMETSIVVSPRDTSKDNSFNHFLKSLKLY